MQPEATLPQAAANRAARAGSGLRAGAAAVLRFLQAEWGLLAAGMYAVVVSVCLVVYGGHP